MLSKRDRERSELGEKFALPDITVGTVHAL